MQIWCMAHPWMTLFLATLMIVAINNIGQAIALCWRRSKREEEENKQ